MAQSNLYGFGSSVASTVDILPDDSRDLGDVDVKSFPSGQEFDISDDGTRILGETEVTNEVAMDIAAQTLAQLTTDISDALQANALDTLRVSSPSPLDVSGAQVGVRLDDESIDTATETTLSSIDSALSNEANVSHGRQSVTTAGTSEQMPTDALSDGKPVAIVGLRSNAGDVYIGGSTVTASNGVPVAPGQVMSLQVSNLNALYVDADNDGDGVAYIAEVA